MCRMNRIRLFIPPVMSFWTLIICDPQSSRSWFVFLNDFLHCLLPIPDKHGKKRWPPWPLGRCERVCWDSMMPLLWQQACLAVAKTCCWHDLYPVYQAFCCGCCLFLPLTEANLHLIWFCFLRMFWVCCLPALVIRTDIINKSWHTKQPDWTICLLLSRTVFWAICEPEIYSLDPVQWIVL